MGSGLRCQEFARLLHTLNHLTLKCRTHILCIISTRASQHSTELTEIGLLLSHQSSNPALSSKFRNILVIAKSTPFPSLSSRIETEQLASPTLSNYLPYPGLCLTKVAMVDINSKVSAAPETSEISGYLDEALAIFEHHGHPFIMIEECALRWMGTRVCPREVRYRFCLDFAQKPDEVPGHRCSCAHRAAFRDTRRLFEPRPMEGGSAFGG